MVGAYRVLFWRTSVRGRHYRDLPRSVMIRIGPGGWQYKEEIVQTERRIKESATICQVFSASGVSRDRGPVNPVATGLPSTSRCVFIATSGT